MAPNTQHTSLHKRLLDLQSVLDTRTKTQTQYLRAIKKLEMKINKVTKRLTKENEDRLQQKQKEHESAIALINLKLAQVVDEKDLKIKKWKKKYSFLQAEKEVQLKSLLDVIEEKEKIMGQRSIQVKELLEETKKLRMEVASLRECVDDVEYRSRHSNSMD